LSTRDGGGAAGASIVHILSGLQVGLEKKANNAISTAKLGNDIQKENLYMYIHYAFN
jgi:hypothetical protein